MSKQQELSKQQHQQKQKQSNDDKGKVMRLTSSLNNDDEKSKLSTWESMVARFMCCGFAPTDLNVVNIPPDFSVANIPSDFSVAAGLHTKTTQNIK